MVLMDGMNESKVIRGPNGKKWGIIKGTRYISFRNARHFCRKFNGWGIQLDVYNSVKEAGVTEIVMVVNGKPLRSFLADWEKHLRIGTLNPNDGEQCFLEGFYFTEMPSL